MLRVSIRFYNPNVKRKKSNLISRARQKVTLYLKKEYISQKEGVKNKAPKGDQKKKKRSRQCPSKEEGTQPNLMSG